MMRYIPFKLTIGLIVTLAAVNAYADDVVQKYLHPSPSGDYQTIGVTHSLTVGRTPDETNPAQAALGSFTFYDNEISGGQFYTLGYASIYGSSVTIDNDFMVGTRDAGAQQGLGLKVAKGLTFSGAEAGEHWVGVGLPNGDRPRAPLDIRKDAIINELQITNTDLSGVYRIKTGYYTGTWAHGYPLDQEFPTIESRPTEGGALQPIFFKGSPYIILNNREYLPVPALTSTGNVGVGVAAPTSKLHIDGDIVAHSYTNTSSRALKTDIQPLNAGDYLLMSRKMADIKMVQYHYKNESAAEQKHTGIIAEEAPTEILSNSNQSVSLSDQIAFVIAAIKSLIQENMEMEKEISRLEKSLKKDDTYAN